MSLLFAIALAVALTQPVSTSAEAATTVPMDTSSGLPTVRVTVSGKPFTLVVDLGGYKGLALSPSALAKLNVKYNGQVETWRNSNGEVFSARLFTAPDVRLGERPLGPVDGIEYNVNSASVDGYIGFAVLRRFSLVFDYPRSVLRIYPANSGEMKRECGTEHPISFEVVAGVVQSKIETDAGELIFQWDTGARENVLRPSALNLDPSSSIASHVFSHFGIGGRDYGRVRIPLREFVAPNVDGILGGEFFGPRKVCLDFNRKLARIE